MILLKEEVKDLFSISLSTLNRRISKGLFPSPIGIGGTKAKGWLKSEIDSVLRAYSEEVTESELKALVAELKGKRG